MMVTRDARGGDGSLSGRVDGGREGSQTVKAFLFDLTLYAMLVSAFSYMLQHTNHVQSYIFQGMGLACSMLTTPDSEIRRGVI